MEMLHSVRPDGSSHTAQRRVLRRRGRAEPSGTYVGDAEEGEQEGHQDDEEGEELPVPVQQLELVCEPGDHRLHPAHLQQHRAAAALGHTAPARARAAWGSARTPGRWARRATRTVSRAQKALRTRPPSREPLVTRPRESGDRGRTLSPAMRSAARQSRAGEVPRGERHVLHPRAGQPCVPADASATGPAAPARGKHRPGRRPCAHQRSPTDPERRRDGGHPGGPLCLTLLRLPPREVLSWLRPHQTCHPRAWSASRGGDPAGGRQRAGPWSATCVLLGRDLWFSATSRRLR